MRKVVEDAKWMHCRRRCRGLFTVSHALHLSLLLATLFFCIVSAQDAISSSTDVSSADVSSSAEAILSSSADVTAGFSSGVDMSSSADVTAALSSSVDIIASLSSSADIGSSADTAISATDLSSSTDPSSSAVSSDSLSSIDTLSLSSSSSSLPSADPNSTESTIADPIPSTSMPAFFVFLVVVIGGCCAHRMYHRCKSEYDRRNPRRGFRILRDLSSPDSDPEIVEFEDVALRSDHNRLDSSDGGI